MNLSALAHWEAAVLSSIRGATGTVEERDAQITRSGMYGEYPAIFRSYRELVAESEDPAVRLEALKRAVFLAWYAAAEPPVYTGIAELPEADVRELMRALDRAIRSGQVDEELRWMLAWYRSHLPVLFDSYGPVPALDELLAGRPHDAVAAHRASPPSFENRGQLGVYWKSVFDSPSSQ